MTFQIHVNVFTLYIPNQKWKVWTACILNLFGSLEHMLFIALSIWVLFSCVHLPYLRPASLHAAMWCLAASISCWVAVFGMYCIDSTEDTGDLVRQSMFRNSCRQGEQDSFVRLSEEVTFQKESALRTFSALLSNGFAFIFFIFFSCSLDRCMSECVWAHLLVCACSYTVNCYCRRLMTNHAPSLFSVNSQLPEFDDVPVYQMNIGFG